MSKDFFSQIVERRTNAIAKLDEQTFAPLIRNHLVQLFRKAHEKDKGLTGVLAAMGAVVPLGEYTAYFDDEETKDEASNWEPKSSWQPKDSDVLAFLSAVHSYDQVIFNGDADDLPYIDNISLADLKTTRSKKARVWDPNGLRAEMRD